MQSTSHDSIRRQHFKIYTLHYFVVFRMKTTVAFVAVLACFLCLISDFAYAVSNDFINWYSFGNTNIKLEHILLKGYFKILVTSMWRVLISHIL